MPISASASHFRIAAAANNTPNTILSARAEELSRRNPMKNKKNVDLSENKMGVMPIGKLLLNKKNQSLAKNLQNA